MGKNYQGENTPDRVLVREDRPKSQGDAELEVAVKKLIKFKKGCATCKLVRADKRLRKRIHISKAYNVHSSDTLSQIHQDLLASGSKITYASILNHVKKHDPPLNTTLGKELSKEILKKKVQVEKHNLKTVELQEPEKLWQNVIKDTNFEMESGNITPTLSEALKAAKDYTEYVSKQKDQQMGMAKMIWSFTSGKDPDALAQALEVGLIEGEGEDDGDKTTRDTSGTAENITEGSDGSDTVHNGTAGDASTRWPSGLHNGVSKA